jgi:hypothetical protein
LENATARTEISEGEEGEEGEKERRKESGPRTSFFILAQGQSIRPRVFPRVLRHCGKEATVRKNQKIRLGETLSDTSDPVFFSGCIKGIFEKWAISKVKNVKL